MHKWSPPLRFGVGCPAQRGETSRASQAQGRGANWAKLKRAEVCLARGAANQLPPVQDGCVNGRCP